jgi:hypothetical protein
MPGFPAEDFTGRRFGRLKVLHRYAGPSSDVKWVCRCDCGNITNSFRTHLKNGQSRSCGCLRSETTSKRAKTGDIRRTHGMRKSPEYGVWSTMLGRCENSNVERYPQYGGRGIKVCERWHKFENFFADMGKRPGPKFSIDRKDNDGNYEPSNCYWATSEEQIYNKQTTRLLDYKGNKLTVQQASEVAGIPKAVLFNRLYNGWSIEKAIETPLRPRAN